MPQGDKTGPEGRGPRTGRGLGNCDAKDQPRDVARPLGRGRVRRPRAGAGRGAGRGIGRGFGRRA